MMLVPTKPVKRVPGLSRACEIWRLMSLGLSTKEIAGKLGLSHKTIEYHREALYRKLKCRSITGVMLKGIRQAFWVSEDEFRQKVGKIVL